MKLGEFEIATISGGRFAFDGGNMFGVVPKALWSRKIPADDNNNIPQDTTCLLVQTGQQNVLIDTGYGAKFSDKQRAIFGAEEGNPLERNLKAEGISPEDIDVVILSHLHFDHVGGATIKNEAGEHQLQFPNAEYVVQKGEWETANARLPELKTAYPMPDILPLGESDQLRLIDGDVEIIPGIRAWVTGGHTQYHSTIIVESDGHSAIFLADICPTWSHLPTFWGMSYDVDMLQVRRIKPEVLGRMADENWLGISDHDPFHTAARIERDERSDFKTTQKFKKLSLGEEPRVAAEQL